MIVKFTRTTPIAPKQTAVLGDYIFAKESHKLRQFILEQEKVIQKAQKFRQKNELSGKLPDGRKVVLHNKYGDNYENCTVTITELWPKDNGLLIAAKVLHTPDDVKFVRCIGGTPSFCVKKNGKTMLTVTAETADEFNWRLLFGNQTKKRLKTLIKIFQILKESLQ